MPGTQVPGFDLTNNKLIESGVIMKYKFFMLCLFFVLSLSSLYADGETQVTLVPDKPQAGNEVLIKFNPNGTELENTDSVTVIIYREVLDTLYCDEGEMVKAGDVWEYKYNLDDSAWCAGIRFSNGETEVTDNGVAFPVLIYDGSGKLAEGTRASFACLCLNGNVSPQPDKHLAYTLFKDEFADNPELTKYFLVKYLFSIKEQEPETWQDTVVKIMSGIGNANEFDEKALTELQYASTYVMMNPGKAEEYKNIAIEKYPLGDAAQTDAYTEISKMSSDNVDELEKAILDFQSKYKQNTTFSNKLWNMLIEAYCKNNMCNKLDELLSQNAEMQKKISVIHSISEGSKIIAENDGNLDSAKYFADLGYKLAKEYKPTETEFRGNTQARINNILNQFINSVLFNCAFVYEKAGEPEAALKYVDEANETGKPSLGIKGIYAKLLLELGKDNNKAMTVSAEIISSGQTDDEILELNKKAYNLVKGSDEGYEEYYSELRKPIIDKLAEKIKTELINEPAYDFSLLDLDGNTVTLSELKGKVIILDFWATWCGPCKASMPLMKEAVEKYADDDEVKFLFVDTFERGSDIEERAKKFMSMNEYPFHVVVDADGKVAKDGYGITAIPAKIFIDKEGNTRYSSKGFNKNTLLDEIDVIIELLK